MAKKVIEVATPAAPDGSDPWVSVSFGRGNPVCFPLSRDQEVTFRTTTDLRGASVYTLRIDRVTEAGGQCIAHIHVTGEFDPDEFPTPTVRHITKPDIL